ncbi:hypothetical protein ED92_22435 [Amycolatopsis sp. MJM2582]|uniref:N-6 DNA methylase n=1 Tax=Amycolatopsis sp. MJM2582 TaxID=1427749 RepID=UPI000502647D|nr:N-6 DNA methylase [Amycolatopsis sp. MJM2582]KFZ80128.1 hypothetical protein ED92_22435 [Amycolatopsis sp. MJM2582]
METIVTKSRAADVVDRLWRAYAPYQRGRNTSDDLASMLAILVLARFVVTAGGPADDFVKRWARAVAEARIGLSPLIDLRAAMTDASRHARFPVPDLRELAAGRLGGEGADDIPWVTAFLVALEQRPTLEEAGLPQVCELLFERHVQESTVSVGEFYTPRAVVNLLVGLVSPQAGDRILDPACGVGGLLAAAAQRIAGDGRVDGGSFEAYATDRSNPRLATMNLAIHGVDRPVVRASDPASLFRARNNGLVDQVISNPPFNQRVEDLDRDVWPFGQPSSSNANFAWLQLAWTRLSEEGIAKMIMPPRAAWSDGRDAYIRKGMIAGGAVLGIIALPSNLFPNTSTPVHIWILARDKSRHLPAGESDAVLFIDGSRLGTQVPRQPRLLTAEDMDRITGRFDAWRRSPRATPDEPGFSRSVTHEEILENGGSLDPRLYVEVEQERSATAHDVNRMLDELVRHDEVMSESSAALLKDFNRCDRLTRGGIEPPRVLLEDIMSGVGEGVIEGGSPGRLIAGPSGSLIRAEDYIDVGGVPVVMPKDLAGDGFSVANIRCITEEQADNLERFRLRSGDIVLARRGELGRCAVVRDEQRGWLCGTGCFLLRPPAGINADYLAAYLRSPEARKWLEAHSTGGMTMKTISLNVLGELPVVLPDLGTQQVIADTMMRLDEHERLVREQLVLTQEIRRDAMAGFFPS